MAVFTMEKQYEVVEDVTSPTIEEVRARAIPGTLKARSMKYRHPRFKTKFSSPTYIVSFRHEGGFQSYCEDTMEALDAALRENFLFAANSPVSR